MSTKLLPEDIRFNSVCEMCAYLRVSVFYLVLFALCSQQVVFIMRIP